MGKIRTYFHIQFMRVLKILPTILLTTTLMCGCVGILAIFFLSAGTEDSRKKYQIGIVGDISDSYLGFGIYAIQSLDDSRFMIDFHNMTEEEAKEELRRGHLSSYARVPDGLIYSLYSGANDRPITFIAGEGQREIIGIVMEEMADDLSVLITRSQSAIYAMQTVLYEHGQKERITEAEEKLSLRYIENLLGRTGLCDLEIVGMANGLSTEGYYFCGFFLVFLLISGINAAPLFCKRSRDLNRLMTTRGVGAFQQVIGEYLAYICLVVICHIVIFAIIGVALGGGFYHITEWEDMGAEPLFGFFVRLLPMMAMMAALQFLLYELVTGIISSILIQFISGIVMCYISGCFYPPGFFPDMLQKIGAVLPTGVALRYTDAIMLDNFSFAAGFGLLIYLLLFLWLSVYTRKCRILKG